MEGALALVNGYLGTRAAVEEGSGVSTPATFLNGVFDATPLAAAEAAATPTGRWPSPPHRAGGGPGLVEAADHRRRRAADPGDGRGPRPPPPSTCAAACCCGSGGCAPAPTTRLRSLRFASLQDRHVLGQALELVAEDWSGPVTVEAVVDGDVTNENGVRHLVGHRTRPVDDGLLLETRTAEEASASAWPPRPGSPATTAAGAGRGRGPASGRWCAATASRRRPAWRLQKLVTVFTGRDDPDPAGAPSGSAR